MLFVPGWIQDSVQKLVILDIFWDCKLDFSFCRNMTKEVQVVFEVPTEGYTTESVLERSGVQIYM